MTTIDQLPGQFAPKAPTKAFLVGPHSIFVRNGLVLNDRSKLECYWVEEPTGFDSPELKVSSVENVQEDGSLAEPGLYGERTMTLSGYIQAGTYTQVMEMGRELLDSLIGLDEVPLLITTMAGLLELPGFGMFQHPDMTINCRPSDRPQLSMGIVGSDITGIFKRNFTIVLKASDPLFRSTIIKTATLVPSVQSELGRAYNRSFPVGYTASIGASGQPVPPDVNEITLRNDGNYAAWPIIRFSGQMNGVVLTNLTNDHSIHLVGTVAAGDLVEINTLTGDIVDQDGNDASSFWNSISDWMRLRGTRNPHTGALSNGDNIIQLTAATLGLGARVDFFWQDSVM